MRAIPELILAHAYRLFWDVDMGSLDPVAHEDFIVARVLEFGDWKTVRALRDEIGDLGLARFCRRAGHRLDRRTQRYFEVVLGLEPDTCKKASWRNNSDALFTR